MKPDSRLTLVSTLLEKTRDKTLEWTEGKAGQYQTDVDTSDLGRFRISIYRAVSYSLEHATPLGRPSSRLELAVSRPDGELVDSFSQADLKHHQDAGLSVAGDVLLAELLGAVRRQVTGADDVIKQIAKSLRGY